MIEKKTNYILSENTAQELQFDIKFVSLSLNGRPLMQANKSETIIHYEQYTKNSKKF